MYTYFIKSTTSHLQLEFVVITNKILLNNVFVVTCMIIYNSIAVRFLMFETNAIY